MGCQSGCWKGTADASSKDERPTNMPDDDEYMDQMHHNHYDDDDDHWRRYGRRFGNDDYHQHDYGRDESTSTTTTGNRVNL